MMAPPEGSGGAVSPGAQTARYQWDLADLYASDAAWEAAFVAAQKRIEELASHKGTLGRDAATMLAAYRDISDTMKDAYRVYQFAALKRDEDQRVPEAQARFGRVQALLAGLGENTSWISPELLAIGPEKIESVGAGVTAFVPGDKVVMFGAKTCGTCQFCKAGQDNLCTDGVATTC